ncbi:MAG: hypothetical protein HYY83_12505 [Deltaproteobacteria bacterium]|nr:hypothetical protein [Deltaproteobacteria bacterium]
MASKGTKKTAGKKRRSRMPTLKRVPKRQRRLQAKVRQLERSNRTKDALLNLLSYELRTPLNVVMGYTGLIRDGMLGKITPAQEKALLKVIGRVKEQLAMINNILYATPRGEKSVKVEGRAANLKEFFNELRLANELPLEKPISLIWDGPREDILLTMDIGKVRLILRTLSTTPSSSPRRAASRCQHACSPSLIPPLTDSGKRGNGEREWRRSR